MLKLLKRLFGCFTKQSTNTTDTLELSFEVDSNFNHAPISTHSHELSIDEYWNHWLTANNNSFQHRIERATWISSQSIKRNDGFSYIFGTQPQPYIVTLSNCTCSDFQNRQNSNFDYPCKHMCRLAIENGIITAHIHTDAEIEEKAIQDAKAAEELSELNRLHEIELDKFRLSATDISNVLSIIDEPELTTPNFTGNADYFSSTSYDNKELKYIDKSDELIDKLSDQYSINKIITIVSQIQNHLVQFKEFLYSKGTCGVDEYNSMHSSDFDDARDQIQSFLLNDYPDNAYDYNEDQKAVVEEKNRVKQERIDKKSILSAISHEPIAQASLIKSLFPDNKSYGKRLCNSLIKEGKLQQVKQGNRYFINKV